jgi:hypothetical protein
LGEPLASVVQLARKVVLHHDASAVIDDEITDPTNDDRIFELRCLPLNLRDPGFLEHAVIVGE